MYKIILILFFYFISLNASTITPIPNNVKYSLKKALLGKKLFFDTRLSKNNTLSCASCHDLKNGGDDGMRVAVGINGAIGDLNSPTVLNAVFNFRQFWDGRARTLEEQALGPIENPKEMAHKFVSLVKGLKNSEYKEEFYKVYKDGITKDNIADAIAEFEKTLITPDSRFDKFLKGDKKALTKIERDGFELFKNKGCISCHHGVNLGGNHYNKFGAIVGIESESLGRYNISLKDEDKYFFKVPTLRNIELTAPYFHDGREYDLENAVETMSLVQLGRPITKIEIKKITAFLKTLTGKLKVIE